jgi:cytochrome c-type biogenesis protein CcmH
MPRATGLLLLGILGVFAGTAAAQDTVPAEEAAPPLPTSIHPEARRAISLIRSPYCPGLMLEVCPSPPAAVLRDSIDVLARTGLPADSIVERVIATYGEEWRAVPRREGTGWWAWLMPPAMLLIGLVMIAVVLARRRRRAPEPPAGPSPDEQDAERLRRALADLDETEHPDW